MPRPSSRGQTLRSIARNPRAKTAWRSSGPRPARRFRKGRGRRFGTVDAVSQPLDKNKAFSLKWSEGVLSMPKLSLRWLTAGCLALTLVAASCGDDTAGSPPDGHAGAGGGGVGGHSGMGGMGGGGAGGMAGSGGGGAGGMAGIDGGGGTGGTAGIDASVDAAIDAAIDAAPDATIDAAPDAYVPSCGNGILDTAAGELCDTGIAPGNTGACPTSCA